MLIIRNTFYASLLLTICFSARFSRRGFYPSRPRESDAAWLETFSIDGYRPMVRLGSQADIEVVATRCDGKAAHAYRVRRRAILRGYLGSLAKDFDRLYSIAIERTVHDNHGTGDFSTALFLDGLNFACLIWIIKAQLLTDVLVPCSVDLEPLLNCFEVFAAQTRSVSQPEFRLQIV
jgi:hypothetical protein